MGAILPNAILLGVQKGGTTALYNWLSQHPAIFGEPAMKDFPFFCKEGYSDRGMKWFSTQFAGHNEQEIILHGYVNYLALGKESAPLIAESLNSPKIFAVLRNPIERAYSAYLQAIKMGRDDAETFEIALDRETWQKHESFATRMDRGYLRHGFYAKNLEVFRSRFPAEDMRVLLFDDLKAEPYKICRDLFNFFGVDNSFRPELKVMNKHARPRSKLVRRMINFGMPIKAIRELIPMNQRINIRRKLHELNFRETPKPRMKAETAAYLSKVYSDEISRLEDLFGRDLSIWRNISS